MKEINKSYVLEKGLEHIRQIKEFKVVGDHYKPYDDVFKELLSTHNVKAEYAGSSDQGAAISIFTKKPSEQSIREEIEKNISRFEKSAGITILKWEI